MRETNFLAWTSQVCKPTSSKISDFEIDGITFEVGGKNKNGSQIKDAERGYLVRTTSNMLQDSQCPFGCLVSFTDQYIIEDSSDAYS